MAAWVCPSCGVGLDDGAYRVCNTCGAHCHCSNCGYDLAGGTTPLCPECGSDVVPQLPPEYVAGELYHWPPRPTPRAWWEVPLMIVTLAFGAALVGVWLSKL